MLKTTWGNLEFSHLKIIYKKVIRVRFLSISLHDNRYDPSLSHQTPRPTLLEITGLPFHILYHYTTHVFTTYSSKPIPDHRLNS